MNPIAPPPESGKQPQGIVVPSIGLGLPVPPHHTANAPPAKTPGSRFDEQARARWRRLFLGSACTLVIVVIAQHMLAIAFDDQLAGLIVAMILVIITIGIVKPIFPT